MGVAPKYNKDGTVDFDADLGPSLLLGIAVVSLIAVLGTVWFLW